MKYQGICMASKDLEKTKAFYKNLLGARVIQDFGENITLTGGYSFQILHSWMNFLGKEENEVVFGGNTQELYFEHDDLEEIMDKIKQYQVESIHGIQEHSWGQRGIRFYDPDKHIIEVSESMSCMVKRMKQQGMNEQEIHQKTGLSVAMVKRFLSK